MENVCSPIVNNLVSTVVISALMDGNAILIITVLFMTVSNIPVIDYAKVVHPVKEYTRVCAWLITVSSESMTARVGSVMLHL